MIAQRSYRGVVLVASQSVFPLPARRARETWRTLRRATNEGKPPCRERSEEHTSELQSLMRISYAVFCLKKKRRIHQPEHTIRHQKPQATKRARKPQAHESH